MKMNKLTIVGLAFTMALVMNCKKPAAAGAGDLNAAANEYIALIENGAKALEAATDGKAAAKILNDAEEAGNALEAKFPQLKSFEKTPELASFSKRQGEAGMALLAALAKADDKFKAVPEFAEAMKKVMKTDVK
jgi:hypothetical protein